MKKIAIILSGCGVFDGSEIHEAVLTLLAIDSHGHEYQCFAPDIEQLHVLNHLTGEEMPEKRNVLVESARISRGSIKSLTEIDIQTFDALIVPGGFGAAKNLCDFAVNGPSCSLDGSVESVCKAFANAGKPAGYMCIAPAMLSLVYGEGIHATIGDDKDTAAALTEMGSVHVSCDVGNIVVDEAHKVVTTPAYMLAQSISEANQGIQKLVAKVIELA